MKAKIGPKERVVLAIAANAYAQSGGKRPGGFIGSEQRTARALAKKGLLRIVGKDPMGGLLAELTPQGRKHMAEYIEREQAALRRIKAQAQHEKSETAVLRGALRRDS